MAAENAQPSQPEINEFFLTRLFVVEQITMALLSIWVSAVPSDDEVVARIDAIRSSIQTGLDGFSDAAREQGIRLLTEKLDRVEVEIKRRRAAIAAIPKS